MVEELNAALLTRTTHGIALTDAGQLLAREAGSLIDRCNNASNLIHIHNLPVNGTLRIACVLELSYAAHIQIFVSRFMERYPDIDVTFEVLSEGTPEQVLYQYDCIFTPCEYHNTDSFVHRHLIPRYVKNLVPGNTFIIGLSSDECRFPEYFYYREEEKNGAAKLFYEEFRSAYFI